MFLEGGNYQSQPYVLQGIRLNISSLALKYSYRKLNEVRNWDYPNGNSCARTDLLYAKGMLARKILVTAGQILNGRNQDLSYYVLNQLSIKSLCVCEIRIFNLMLMGKDVSNHIIPRFIHGLLKFIFDLILSISKCFFE